MPLPSLNELVDAAEHLRGRIFPTPLLAMPEAGVWLKPENLQRTNSFKIRGASHFLARLTPEERRRGVVTHSSGNHAQGVACAAADEICTRPSADQIMSGIAKQLPQGSFYFLGTEHRRVICVSF